MYAMYYVLVVLKERDSAHNKPPKTSYHKDQKDPNLPTHLAHGDVRSGVASGKEGRPYVCDPPTDALTDFSIDDPYSTVVICITVVWRSAFEDESIHTST